MDAVLNPEKGEIGIRLEGRLFPMLPDMTACNAIESQIGSVQWLWVRFARRDWLPTLHEMSVIVAECIRAAGRARDDAMLAKVSTERIAQLVFAEGVVLLIDPVSDVLSSMCTGGATKKNSAASPSSTPSEQTGSPTGS